MPRKTAILCPNCRRLVNVEEPRCPYCGAPHPGSRWLFYVRTLGGLNEQNLVRYVIYVNVGMFVLSLLLNPWRFRLTANPLTFLSPSPQSLLLLGETGTFAIERLGRWWTLLSANYLHGGILHIFFNMAALYQLGPIALREYGMRRTFTIYTLGGIAGFFVSYLVGIRFTIGASAAVCALIGAMLYYGTSRGGVYGQVIVRQIGGWVVGLLLFGFVVPGINNWAHGGGIAAGFLLGMALGYQERRREQPIHRLLATACIVGTVAVLAWAVATALFYRLGG